MTIQPNTTPAANATLSEKELFAEFAAGSVTYGPARRRHTTDVASLFCAFGETECFTDALLAAFELLLDQDNPTFELECIRDTALGIVNDLNIAIEGFEDLKAERLIEDGTDSERYVAPGASMPEAA